MFVYRGLLVEVSAEKRFVVKKVYSSDDVLTKLTICD